MPPPLRADDVWAADRPGRLAAAVRHDPYRIYVPNSGSDTVSEIDPRSHKVIRTFRVGRQPQHVVPAYDLRMLWVNNDLGNSLTPIDPRTGRPGRPVHVTDPYNLYFTPDGRYAVVMTEARHRIDFLDPHSMRLERSLHVPCGGVNHADFSADGRYFLVSCEFTGQLLRIDTLTRRITGMLRLKPGSKPQDVKLSPDGRTFYVADMVANGVWRVSGSPLRLQGFVHTGKGAHGLYVTRDSRRLLVTNRDAGSVSVLSFATGKVVTTWHIRGGGSPDMGNLSPDGRSIWLSGRYNGVVYELSTSTGRLLAKTRVGSGPHGLCVWPQPGRYSLGHTGIMR
ncbi:MAG TPA: YncE family protein [Streptosporangiales bacterium]